MLCIIKMRESQNFIQAYAPIHMDFLKEDRLAQYWMQIRNKSTLRAALRNKLYSSQMVIAGREFLQNMTH